MLQVVERSQEAMMDGAQGGSAGGLAHLLLNSYQERLIQNRLQEQQEREECAQEEEEDDGKVKSATGVKLLHRMTLSACLSLRWCCR